MLTIPDAVLALDRNLKNLFGPRLKSLVAYGGVGGGTRPAIATLAVVDGIGADDLRACAARMPNWQDLGLATPLLVAEREFGRSLDAFPLEFGAIMADYRLVSGVDPFEGLTVDTVDIRRACEVAARSHLLHLREGYLEAQNRSDRVAELILRSSGPLAALVRNVSRLHGPIDIGPGVETPADAARRVEAVSGLPPGSLSNVAALADGQSLTPERAREIFQTYLDAVTALTNYIDRWHVNAV